MNVAFSVRLRKRLPTVSIAEPSSNHTTFKVGGHALYFFTARSDEDLIDAIRAARELDVPFYLIAGGSNLVFGDGIVAGLCIKIDYGDLAHDHMRISSDAGVSLARLIEYSFEQNLAGLEKLAGIPGTVGGAIVGNAGAYGRSMKDIVESVTIFDSRGVRTISREECAFAYRHSAFKHNRDWVVLSATCLFEPGQMSELAEIARETIRMRERNYLPGLLCPGSFFKNVPESTLSVEAKQKIDETRIIKGKVPAGYLLEMVGAKGSRRGGIRVSDNHGNLFINDGTATYADVRALAEELKQKVLDKFGIALEEEIRYIT